MSRDIEYSLLMSNDFNPIRLKSVLLSDQISGFIVVDHTKSYSVFFLSKFEMK